MALGRFNDPLQHSVFNFEELTCEDLLFVARAGHPLLKAKTVCLNELARWPWTLQPLQNPTRILLEREFSINDIRTPANVVVCSSVFAILQLLQHGDSIALLPEPVVRDHLNAQLLSQLPIKITGRLPAFGILTRRNGRLRPTAEAFVEALRFVASTAKKQ